MDSRVTEMSENVGKALSVVLGELTGPVGPFVSLIFGFFWSGIFAGATAGESQDAMNRLFEAIEKMIQEALAELIADQARAYNSTVATFAQDYKTAQQEFLDNPSRGPGHVVTRFEILKGKLLDMINLYSQKTYIKYTLLSYAFTLSSYVVLLQDGVINGKHYGYGDSEIHEFKEHMDSVLEVAYKDVLGHALLTYYSRSSIDHIDIPLSKIVGGLMHFHSKWGFPHTPSRNLFPFSDHDVDVVDFKARYLLNTQILVHGNIYPRVQIFLKPNIDALMLVHSADTDNITKLPMAKFKSQNSMDVRFRLYYFVQADPVDEKLFASANFKVLVKNGDTTVHEFWAGQPSQEICSFLWTSLSTGNFGNQMFAGIAMFPALLIGAMEGMTPLTMRYCSYSDVFKMEAGVNYSVHLEPGISLAFIFYLGIEVEPVNIVRQLNTL